jgi:NitT/TauT family transport system ATP-binding protein
MEAIRLSDRILLLKSDPGEVIKTYEISQPKSLRDDEFVFEQTRKFLSDKDILEIFEIKVR